MFLEAERRGIELRPHQAVDANTGVSDKLSIGGGDSKSMVFSFFAAEPIDNGDDDGCDSAHLNNSNHQQQQHGGGGDIDRLDANTSAVLHSNITNNVSRRDDETQQANTKPIVMHWTISEIVQMAKSFSRSKSIEQMTEDWKVEREKLKIDYKRKMRDFKRRTASWSSEKTTVGGVGAGSLKGSRNDTRSNAVEIEHDGSAARHLSSSNSRYRGNKSHHGRGRRKGKN